MKTILCYGDSNTWGYDPRSFFGGRYDPDSRWCDLLEKKLGCRVVNGGENGRCLPRRDWERQDFLALLEREQPLELLILMLGTNDALREADLSPEKLTERLEERMDGLLACLRQRYPALPALVLAPPRMALPVPGLCEALARAASGLERAAGKWNCRFLDTGSLPLAFDGVHLSEQGHRELAENLSDFLQREILHK